MTLAILTFHAVPPRLHFFVSFGEPQLYHIGGLWNLPMTTPLFTLLVRRQLLLAVVITQASSLFKPKLLCFPKAAVHLFLVHCNVMVVYLCHFGSHWQLTYPVISIRRCVGLVPLNNASINVAGYFRVDSMDTRIVQHKRINLKTQISSVIFIKSAWRN